MASATLCFSVDPETCADIIAYYDKLPRGEKSREFVRVHKMHLDNAGITLADLNAKLDHILERLSATPTVTVLRSDTLPGDVKIDLSNLDDLGV